MDFMGGGLPLPPGHPGGPQGHLYTTLDGRGWIGGRHADDDSPCRHGIPDNQANGPRPAGGYTCRVTGRPVVFDFPEEETERPGENTARPRIWPWVLASATCLAAAVALAALIGADVAPGAWAWVVLGLIGAGLWAGRAAGRRRS
jgi:hypothetical protein